MKLHKQGELLAEKGLFSEALKKYEAAMAICMRFGESEELGNLEYIVGATLSRLGENDKALAYYGLAISDFERLWTFQNRFDTGDTAACNRITRKLAETYQKAGKSNSILGRQTNATTCFGKARDFFLAIEDEEKAAMMEMNIGQELFLEGKNNEALDHYRLAEPILRRLDCSNPSKGFEFAQAFTQIGRAFRNTNQYDDALMHFRDAKRVLEKLQMWAELADVCIAIGDTFSIIGKSEDAMKYYDQARDCLATLPVSKRTRQISAGLAMGAANTFQDMKQYDKAIEQYNLAKNIFEHFKDAINVAEINMNVGNTLSLMGRFQEALHYYDDAKEIFVNLGKQQRIAEVDMNSGNTLKRLKRFPEAKRKYEDAIKVCKEYGFVQTKSDALGGLAEILEYMGDFQNALACLQEAIELMEWVRTGVRSPDLQRKLRERYLQKIDALGAIHLMLLTRGESPENLVKAFNAFELAKCATLAESLEMASAGVSCPEMTKLVAEEDKLLNMAAKKTAELEQLMELRSSGEMDGDKFRGAYTDWSSEYSETYKDIEKLRCEVLLNCADVGSTPVPRGYQILERALEVFPKDKKWCVLEYVFSSSIDRWFVFLIGQNGIVYSETLRLKVEEINNKALLCRDVVKSIRNYPGGMIEADKMLSSLSTELFPILIPEKTLEILGKIGPEYLMIVPHGVLHWVPFEVLSDGEITLGLEYDMSTNFSLDVGRICIEKRAKRTMRSIEHPAFLIVQNPLGDLDGADDEAFQLTKLVQAKKIQFTILHREKATEAAFIRAANDRPFSVLHHAGHAVFMGKDPSLSSLWLHANNNCEAKACGGGGEIHKPELLNATEIISRIKFKTTPLIYLSACETGISEVEPGEEAFGLVRALMYAGATSLVTSRWEVKDVVGPVFAEAFYSCMLSGESAATALRKAREIVFKQSPSSFTDWGVFSLCGDPFRTIA